MNKFPPKLLCICIFIVSFSFNVKANLKDTTILLADNQTEASALSLKTYLIKEANVIYPERLQSHIDESLDYVQKFSESKKGYLTRTFQKGKKFFPKITSILKKYNLPQELKVLIALESAFNANALSGAGAKGYWQFMDAPAKEYGLKIIEANDTTAIRLKKKDDRTNFIKSTNAAAKYLKDRCKNLNNDLLLIVASYNWGVGNVWQAIRKTGKPNADFWDIKKYLPAETKAYVMNFIALNVVFNNYDKFIKNKLIFNSESITISPSENIRLINNSITD